MHSLSVQERELAQAELDGKSHLYNSVSCEEKGFPNLTDWMMNVLLKVFLFTESVCVWHWLSALAILEEAADSL